MRVVLDYETRSEADLKKVGAVNYAKHPSTEIICLGYKIDDEPTLIWIPGKTFFPRRLLKHLEDPNVILIAHNAMFEHVITKYVLSVNGPVIVDINRWHCTAARSAALALPRSLEGVGKVLNLPIQKDVARARLIKKYFKPRPAWVKWCKSDKKKPEPPKWYDDEFELWDMYEYNRVDVEATYILDKKIPELIPFEKKIWCLNIESNLRGVKVDLPIVNKIISLANEETENYQKRLREITNYKLQSVLQRDAVIKWLRQNGLRLETLTAGAVAAALDGSEDGSFRKLNPLVREVLKIRQAVSKTSNKKYIAMRDRADYYGRVTDLSLYHGAATGREAGRGLQPHNFPRGSIKNTNLAIDVINELNDLESVRMFYGSPSRVFSSCIRGMIIPDKDKKIISADLNAIECRVLNWLAGCKEVLNDFAEGRDPYVKMASRIFGLPLELINGDQRFLGKTAELGCGYQMGPPRFYKTCIDWGVPNVTEELAFLAVNAYRESHLEVTQYWKSTEAAAIAAVQTKCEVKNGLVTWYMRGKHLFAKLPSGRSICFPFASVRNEENAWGNIQAKLYYYRINPKGNKRFEEVATYGGSLVESLCQAIARDVTMNGIVNTTDAGFDYLFQVHDEINSEGEVIEGSEDETIKKYCELFAKKPAWAKGLPIKASGWIGPRYKK